MAVSILYFAGVKDLTGTPREELELPPAVDSVSALRAHLEAHRPELQGRLVGVRFAVNEEFAKDTETVKDGDVIAVIPPVAGG